MSNTKDIQKTLRMTPLLFIKATKLAKRSNLKLSTWLHQAIVKAVSEEECFYCGQKIKK